MAALKSKTWFWGRRQYFAQAKTFNAQVEGMLEAAEAALAKKSYGAAGQTAVVLRHVFCSASLKPHLGASFQRWGKLSRTVAAAFRTMCGAVQGALDNGDLPNCETCLRRMHDFEEGLSQVFGAELRSEAQGVHQALAEWTERQMKALHSQLRDLKLGAAAESVR